MTAKTRSYMTSFHAMGVQHASCLCPAISATPLAVETRVATVTISARVAMSAIAKCVAWAAQKRLVHCASITQLVLHVVRSMMSAPFCEHKPGRYDAVSEEGCHTATCIDKLDYKDSNT
jgi:hypothetical protein